MLVSTTMNSLNNKDVDFMALYNPVHARFERFCRARVYGDMFYKDLMHDAIVVAYEKFDSLKNEKAFLHFLFGIAIRILANSNRKKRPESLRENQSAFQFEDASNRADKNDEINLLYQALALINTDQREAIILFEISGFSIEEIADITKVSQSAVKQRLRRGRQELLSVLSKNGVKNHSAIEL